MSFRKPLKDLFGVEFLSNCAQNSTGFLGVKEDGLEKVAEAKDDSLEANEDPREDVEDRLDVDPLSRRETLGGRFSVVMVLPWLFWLNGLFMSRWELEVF